MSFTSTNGKITLDLYGGTYTDSSTSATYDIDETTIITFFDPTNQNKDALSPRVLPMNESLVSVQN